MTYRITGLNVILMDGVSFHVQRDDVTGDLLITQFPYVNAGPADTASIELAQDLLNNSLTEWAASNHSHAMAEESQLTIPGTLLDTTYSLIQKAKHAGTITGFVASCASLVTAGTYTVKINGNNVTGLTSVTNTVTSTETLATANNTFAIGDNISIAFTGSLTLLNFQGQLSTTRVIS